MGYLDVLKIGSSIVASLYDRVRRIWVVRWSKIWAVCDLEICRETGKQVEFKYSIFQLLEYSTATLPLYTHCYTVKKVEIVEKCASSARGESCKKKSLNIQK